MESACPLLLLLLQWMRKVCLHLHRRRHGIICKCAFHPSSEEREEAIQDTFGHTGKEWEGGKKKRPFSGRKKYDRRGLLSLSHVLIPNRLME